MGTTSGQGKTDGRGEGPLAAFAKRPMLKYAGFSLLLAWHYTLWFVPHSFALVPLLDDRVTYSWLVNLGSTVVFLLLIALALGRKQRLSNYRWLRIAAPTLMCVGTLALTLWAVSLPTPLLAYAIAFLLGPAEAALWILWGERYACVKANFSIRHIGTVFGITMIVCMVIAWALPAYASSAFTSLLPLASGALLIVSQRDGQRRFPVLLPEQASRSGLKNMAMVSTITFLASVACYFLVAIIPWEVLPTGDTSFTIGTLCGGAIMLAIAGVCALSKDRTNVFKLYPWLLVFEIVAFSLFLSDEAAFFPAFFVALGISALFEILLIMYFGILTSKGYTTPAVAFSFSGSFARAGIAVGNSTRSPCRTSIHPSLPPPSPPKRASRSSASSPRCSSPSSVRNTTSWPSLQRPPLKTRSARFAQKWLRSSAYRLASAKSCYSSRAATRRTAWPRNWSSRPTPSTPISATSTTRCRYTNEASF